MTPLEMFALRQSLLVAGISVITVLPLVLIIGWILVAYNFPGKIFLETIVLFPLVLPPVVTGYLLLLLLRPDGILGWMKIPFTPMAAVLASSVVIFPLMLRPVKVSMAAIDPSLIKVSRGLGRNTLYTYMRVVLPLSLPGIIAGAVLGFARSLGEFGATIMVAGNVPFQTTTIPLAIFSFFNRADGQESVTRLVIISLILSFAALLLSEYFLRKQKHVES